MGKFDKVYKEIVEQQMKKEHGAKEMSVQNMLTELLPTTKAI